MENEANENNVTEQENGNNVTIEEQATSAADGTAEDTLDAYKAMFQQMKQQNDSLLEANKSLQNQIGLLIRNGNSVVHSPNTAENQQVEEKEPYVPLADLGSEIGKRDYRSHNTNRGD